MNLKNYTTQVSAETSISQIEKLLVKAGATGIMKEYQNGLPTSIVFRLPIPTGNTEPPSMATVKLPANVDACHKAMWQKHVQERSCRSRKTDSDFKAQALRTAWRVMLDWMEVQLTLIHLKQLEPLQAFLPYCFDGQRTFYERARSDGFQALLPPHGES